MRIYRLEFGIATGPQMWDLFEASCFCKMLELGPFYVHWLSYECIAGIYKDKARRYRIQRYLEERRKRKTNLPPSPS